MKLVSNSKNKKGNREGLIKRRCHSDVLHLMVSSCLVSVLVYLLLILIAHGTKKQDAVFQFSLMGQFL